MLFAIYSSALGTCSVYDSGLYIITRRQLHRTIGTDTRNSEECQVLLFLSPASYEIKRSRWSPYIHTIYTHLRAHACARAHTHTHTHTHRKFKSYYALNFLCEAKVWQAFNVNSYSLQKQRQYLLESNMERMFSFHLYFSPGMNLRNYRKLVS